MTGSRRASGAMPQISPAMMADVVIARSAQRDEAISATRAGASEPRLLRGACHRAGQRPDPLARSDGSHHLRSKAAPAAPLRNPLHRLRIEVEQPRRVGAEDVAL